MTLVVGVPGTLCSPAIFARVFDSLLAAEPTADVTAIPWMTRPGPWELDAVADRTASEIRSLAKGAAIVVGHSTGGAIAQRLALIAPDVVGGLALVNTGPHMREHGDVAAIIETVRRAWGDDIREAILRRSFDNPPPDDVMAELRSYAAGCEAQAVVDILSSQKDTDFSDHLGAIACRVSIIHGIRDPVRSAEQAQAFASLFPAADLTLLECGHTPPLEAPDEVAAIVQRLLRRHESVVQHE